MYKNVVVVAALVVGACGSGKGVPVTGGSDAPAGQTTFVSGYDGSPVAAQVTVSGELLTATAPGFLTLETVERHRPVYLFPNDTRVTLVDTFQYVYGGSDFNPLRRLGDSTTTVGVVAAGELINEPAVAEGINAINALMASAEVNLRFVLGDTGQVRVDLVIDPTDPVFANPDNRPGAATYNQLQGHILVGARVVIHDLQQVRLRPTIEHELMHTFGLGHSVHQGPMMLSADVYSYSEFTELDRLYVRFIRMRQPGTRIFFDRITESDRDAVTRSSAGLTVDVIVCP